MKTANAADLDRFYEALARLSESIGGPRQLADCDASSGWPTRGVYFFFEPGELRASSQEARVVRVGTHAVSAGSKTTLWTRLKQHRGQGKPGEQPGRGNHRGSIFRRHVGMALLRAGRHSGPALATWGVGSSAPGDVVAREASLERLVSDYIGRLGFLWLDADDEPSAASIRSYIERNSIGMLSAASDIDPPSTDWLGVHSADERIRKSGLWNVNYVGDGYDPAFLDVLDKLVAVTWRVASRGFPSPPPQPTLPEGGENLPRPVIVFVSCAKGKEQRPCTAAELYAPSDAFRKAFAIAGRISETTLILSAKYGAVRPSRVLAPYDETLIGAPRERCERWAWMVHEQLRSISEYRNAKSVVWLAPEDYRRDLLPLVEADGKMCSVPMEGLRQGEQRAWLKKHHDPSAPLLLDSIVGSEPKQEETRSSPRIEAPLSPAPKSEDFRRALTELKAKAAERGHSVLEISAGELHRFVGGYPGTAHRMPACCSVMRQELRGGDTIVSEPPKGAGASLRIAYRL